MSWDQLCGRTDGVCGRTLGYPVHTLFTPYLLFTNNSIFNSTSPKMIMSGCLHQKSPHRSFHGHKHISMGFQNVPNKSLLLQNIQNFICLRQKESAKWIEHHRRTQMLKPSLRASHQNALVNLQAPSTLFQAWRFPCGHAEVAYFT